MQHLFARWMPSAWRATLAGLALAVGIAAPAAQAQSLIRDAEIEETLRLYADPILQSQGLTPSSITLYIVNDPGINAFVMGGSNIFINTGLLMTSETPDMVLGVLAHEAGHISGGHLARLSSEVERAQLRALVGYLLGAAAMAGGAGDVGAAVMSANESLTMRGLYSFTRANEQSADQAALSSLDQLGISASGMMSLFEILRKYEYRKAGSAVDPYTRTHPLTTERINHIRNHVRQSSIPPGKVPENFLALHARMLGKLEGFLDDPATVLTRYPASRTDIRARYARAVAYHRQVLTEKALAEVDALLASMPKDAYIHELKGQILYESGRIDAAMASYRKAVELLPDAPLIRAELGRTLVAKEDPQFLPEAIRHLEYATSADRRHPLAWRLLGTAYGRQGRLDLSHLSLAEESLLLNKPDQAIQQLDIAQHHIKEGTPAQLRAQDLREEAVKMRKEKEKNKNG